jgi:hypothetical protein
MAHAQQAQSSGGNAMSIRMGLAVAVGLGAVVALGSVASAEMFAPAKGKKVSFSACAVKQGDCVVAPYKGKNYNITAQAPANLGQKVKVSGVDTGAPSCGGALRLDNLKVGQTRSACKQAKKK